MKPYYVQIKDIIKEEEKFYSEEYKSSDWVYLKDASELFLIHAYTHLFLGSENRFEIIGDVDYLRKHRQFYLNLAIGLELLLKSIMLKQEMPINKQMKLNGEIHLDKEKTLQFSEIIKNNIANIFSNIDQLDLEELKDTLK